jgi:hypothetical protein
MGVTAAILAQLKRNDIWYLIHLLTIDFGHKKV